MLDDDKNLAPGGGAFRDPGTAALLGLLARNTRRGRLLLTCRHPVPGIETFLHRIPLGPLSLAESRKLLLRLPAWPGARRRVGPGAAGDRRAPARCSSSSTACCGAGWAGWAW